MNEESCEVKKNHHIRTFAPCNFFFSKQTTAAALCCRQRRRPLNAAAARSENGSRGPFLRLENGPITKEDAVAALCGSAAIVMLMRPTYAHPLIRSHTHRGGQMLICC